MRYRIFIDGREGTTGLKIQKRLQDRDDLEILSISDNERKNLRARLEIINKADITFLCLPDDASREIAKNAGKDRRIIDTSTAHRTNNEWVYGFPELNAAQKDRIKGSNRVAVPGCHATGFISLVNPLVSLGIIKKDYPFTCHSITGYSGGGKSMIAQYESNFRNQYFDSPRQYGLTQHHKHLPEMKAMTGISHVPVFLPIVADYYSGMLATVSLHGRLIKDKKTPEELRRIYSEYYKEQIFIQVREFEEYPEDGFMPANELTETDGLELFVTGNEEQMILMARYDNLGKGASGAAIQCMNIMLGLPESKGLVIKNRRKENVD
ncbi:MAG: N-acetyl-gamma-glutamyl-phosphate reductase [Eubacteriales bacterium]|nr:N-acetyl-gamma-glutamyl-phosphate reductase [Eubacteriales bacterium]MDD3200292.1 N-acetyl-gamma-glutamyl-phosphate reductase [Eubacteriales bacterium]MDD4630253.1 N-acetyl-gamma-glutamyl-phosphate reductase [Eubacteriales bacterium]